MTNPPDRYPTAFIPKRQGKSLYMERLLDALHGRSVTYVCSDKHKAAKVKKEIEDADADIRNSFLDLAEINDFMRQSFTLPKAWFKDKNNL